jgi:cysteine desulfurase / selenocysteine lyase
MQPEFLPDIYESGTLNVAGLAGLAAGVHYLHEIGIERVMAHERELVAVFIKGASEIAGLTVYGSTDASQRCGVISFNMNGLMPSEVSMILDQRYDIQCRPGLHCAPGAHRSIGTFPTGTTRFSFGYFNTLQEVDTALAALEEIAMLPLVEKEKSHA